MAGAASGHNQRAVVAAGTTGDEADVIGEQQRKQTIGEQQRKQMQSGSSSRMGCNQGAVAGADVIWEQQLNCAIGEQQLKRMQSISWRQR